MTPIDADTPLPDDIEAAHRLIRELLATLREQTHLNANLQHQLEQLLRKIYGRKSEKLDPNQLLLFARAILEAAGPETPPVPEPVPETPAKRSFQGHGRKPLPASLTRRRVMHDVPPEQRLCPDCGAQRACIGEEVREQLEYVLASLIVLQHVRPKYACAACQAHVVIAERLPEPIEKGLPGPGLMAHVAVSKYADHQPLYRQEGVFKRFGVDLSRSTMCDWMAAAAGLLAPIVREMLKRVLMSEVVQTDDTPVKVQDHEGKGIKTGRLWVQIGDHKYHDTVYDDTPDRSGDGPRRVFKGYKGYLQADAYSAYDELYADGTIIEVGCWMHARRKFHEARTSDPVRSHLVLAWVVGLYKVEDDAKEARKKHPEWDDAAWHAFRSELRLQRSRPILDAIHAWLEGERPKVLPKSPIGEAIGYALNHWGALIRPLEAGFLEIDNGASERALKPVALGRKNWLFAGSDEGGRTAATLMSLCTTCKDLGVEPFAYLRDVLDRVSTHPNSRIEELRPDRWKPAESTDPAGRKGSIKVTPSWGRAGAVKHRDPAETIRRGFLAREGQPRRAALYARVSTHDPQTLGLQIEAMSAYIKDRGWDIVSQVKDVGSGAKDRAGRESLIRAARRREIDVVVVWRLDRWGRSPPDLLVTLRELTELGVGFISLIEALNLTTPTGRAMAGMLAVFAEFEREILRERVRAGIAQARKEGRPHGRPRTASLKADQVLPLKAERVSHSEIARRLGIGRTSVRRILEAGWRSRLRTYPGLRSSRAIRQEWGPPDAYQAGADRTHYRLAEAVALSYRNPSFSIARTASSISENAESSYV